MPRVRRQRAHHPHGMFVRGQEGGSGVGIGGFHVQADRRIDVSRVVNRETSPAPVNSNAGTVGSHSQSQVGDVRGTEGPSESVSWIFNADIPAIANFGTSEFHNLSQVPHVSNSQLPVTSAAPTGAGSAPRGNDYNINANNVYGNLNLQDQSSQHITNIYGGQTDDLKFLEKSFSYEAQFDSSVQDPNRKCHPGTRTSVLTALGNWVDDPKSTDRICWLYGPAGAGKSAIAQTIARSYKRPKVAATFFFFKSDVNRNDGNRLFPTLAYQIALSMPATRAQIAKSLSERPDLPKAGIETQFKELLARPFHVLCEDASQQLAPAVDVISNILKQYRELAPVIIIDGIDECTDENLQRQFLKVIGNAVTDDRFPLRFFITSRPEVHIEQTIHSFHKPVLTIDLSKLGDANQDIEKYLVDEFSRIALEKDLDPIWPDRKIIHDILDKSSGNFIFASLVIRFIDDPHCYAPTQLDIVLNFKPPKTTSPFALLDQLYLEILKRVPDQDFLKRYLALFTARISVLNGGGLHKDDAMVMDVSEKELHANLSRMRSILKFDSQNGIDVHHKSFLDFLYDKSRSGQYYIPKPDGGKHFVGLFIDSLIQYISTAIGQDDHRHVLYSGSAFRLMIKSTPPKFTLPTHEWQEVIRPLLDFQDYLRLPKVASSLQILSCPQCVSRFILLRELLHVGLHHGIFEKDKENRSVIQSVMNVRKREGFVSWSKIETPNAIRGDKLDKCLQSLLFHLPETMLGKWSPKKKLIKFVKAMLCFDYVDTATRVRFISDAQKLMDLLDYLINEKDILVGIGPDATRRATRLALEIFARVPALPLSSLLKENNNEYYVLSRTSQVIRDWLETPVWLEWERLPARVQLARERLERGQREWERREWERLEWEQWERERERREQERREQERLEWEQLEWEWERRERERQERERQEQERQEQERASLLPLDKSHTDIRLLFWTLFTNRILDHCYVAPIMADREIRLSEILRGGKHSMQGDSFLTTEWRSIFNRHSTIIQVALEIAKIIQYFHSMDIVLDCTFSSDNIYLDRDFHSKICCLRSPQKSRFPIMPTLICLNSCEGDIFSFGLIIYELFRGSAGPEFEITSRKFKRPSMPKFPEYAWRLIQRCRVEDATNRPTINEVVEEIERWRVMMPTQEPPTGVVKRKRFAGISCFRCIFPI